MKYQASQIAPRSHFEIQGRPVGPGQGTYIVAEIGGNHGGSPELAAQMVRAAASAGVEAVKFQAYQTNHFLSSLSPYYEELAGEELPFDSLAQLVDLAHNLGLAAGLTVFDGQGIELGRECGADFLKISSGDLTHHHLIKQAAMAGLPLFISTGAGTAEEVAAARAVGREAGGGMVVLQCAALYPAPPETANLRVMANWLAQGWAAGYSDHTLGLEAARLALALQAVVLEKHFTTDPALPGGDNDISGTPEEFRELVGWRDSCQTLLGQAAKEVHPLEEKMRPIIRRAVLAEADLPAGAILTQADLTLKRPPTAAKVEGPERLGEFIGQKLLNGKTKGQPILLTDLESDHG